MNIPDYLTAWLLQAYRRPRSFLLGLVALPLLVVLLVTYGVNVSLVRQQSLHNLHVTARLAAEIVHETLNETFRFEQLLISQPGFAQAAQRRDGAQLTQRLDEALRFIPRADLAMVVSPEGEVVASSSSRPELVGRRVAQEEPFVGAQQRGWRPYLSAVYLREGPQIEKVVGAVWPVTDGDAVVGLLQVQHRVEEIKSWLQKIRVDPDGFIYVVDHRDQLVVYPFQVLPGRPRVVSSWPPVARTVTDSGGTLVFLSERNHRRWLAGIHPVGTTGWRVVAVQPEGAALRTFHRVFGVLALLVVILLLAVMAVSLRWAQLHAFSLELMHQNAKLLRQGQQRRMEGR